MPFPGVPCHVGLAMLSVGRSLLLPAAAPEQYTKCGFQRRDGCKHLSHIGGGGVLHYGFLLLCDPV